MWCRSRTLDASSNLADCNGDRFACSYLYFMRYRLTVVSVFAAALAGAALLFILTRGEDSPPEHNQTELFPDGLGIVAGFTATARAGGAALDPTAFASPTSTSTAPRSTTSPGDTPLPETGDAPIPVVSLSEREVMPGDTVTVQVSGASPGESFELTLGTSSVVASSIAGADGRIEIEVTVPEGLAAGSMELAYEGATSGTGSIAISVSASDSAPSMVIDPEDPAPGDSITISAENFEPGEPVTVRMSGEIVASGIAGSDGSFSVTTGLPSSTEAPGTDGGPQQVSVEGRTGTVADGEINPEGPVSAQPTATKTSGSAVGGPQDGSKDARQGDPSLGGDSDEEPSSGADSSGSGLPAWLYLAIGVAAGWLGVLTLWVIHLDGSRDRQVAVLVKEIDRLILDRNTGRESQPLRRDADPEGRNRAA